MRLDSARIRQLEAFERSMYRDFYGAAPRSAIDTVGLASGDERFGLLLSSTGENHPFFNRVMLCEQPTQPELTSVAEYYRSREVSRWMLQTPPFLDPIPGDIFEPPIVELRGWAKHLWNAAARDHLEAPTSIKVEVRPIAADEAVPWAQIVVQGFAFPPACVEWLAALADRPAWRLYLAFVDSQPAATGALFANGDRAALNFAATLPEFRRLGAQSALIHHRIRDALDRGISTIVSETDEPPAGRTNPSAHNLIRQGMPVVYIRRNTGPPPPVNL